MPGDETIEFRVQALEEDSRRNQETHKEFYARFEDMGREYTRIDTQYANILTTMGRMEAAIADLTGRPSKRWDSVVAAVITGVVGFVVAWALRGGA